jgi:hypothetical protein
MTRLTRRTGTRCLAWLIPSFLVVHLGAGGAGAQEVLKPDQRNRLDEFRAGRAPFSPDIKEICDKAAAGYVARLSDANYQRPGAERGMSYWVHDLSQRLGLPDHGSAGVATYYARLPAERKPFIEEFGKSLVAALQGPATSGGNPLVQINANRMIAEVCRAGYDGAAEVCLRVLDKKDASDAARFYALQGLKNLFAITPERDAPPEKTVFQKDNTGQLSPLEKRCIEALINYVFRQPPADVPEQQVDALFYVRREAVRALALVRVQQVKKDTKTVICRPSLALLKVARGDGLNPPSVTPQGPDPRAVGERVEAIIGFCNLVPPRSDRDLNVDYAVYHIGRAIQELAPAYRPNDKSTSMPWKLQAIFLRDALQNWAKRSREMKGIENAQMIQDLLDIVDRDILKSIEEGKEESRPDLQNLDQWLRANPPKNKSLFKDDPKTTVNVP